MKTLRKLLADATEGPFTFKPFEWSNNAWDCWYANAAAGSYAVEQRENGSWFWRYCWDEYYDEGHHDCESLEDGQQKAEAHFQERVKEFLVPAETALPAALDLIEKCRTAIATVTEYETEDEKNSSYAELNEALAAIEAFKKEWE